jgi:class 3 adenylate cyclase
VNADSPEEELARENVRLARRVKRLESTLEQVELIRDGNAQLLNRVMSELDTERGRSRDLLLNVLPASIVARLDAGETHIADGHAQVAVLMADLVGFTEKAGGLAPAQLVDELNGLFVEFDEACSRRGVEKIKTIGDAYMAVAGLDGDSDRSIPAAADLGLDMLSTVATSNRGWQMRVGLHAGPVVAGIIGSRKFAFDVWGDTVNLASRLESTAVPGRLHVSQVVADALSGEFVLEPRGQIELKGKGATSTWFVGGRRSTASL